MLTELSRIVLFGVNNYDMRKKPTLRGWAWGHAQNMLRRSIGLHEVSAPGLADFAKHYIDKRIANWTGRDALPHGWPADVFNALDSAVRARGGYVQVGDQKLPAFYLERKTARVLSFLWVAFVNDNGDEADLKKLQNLELALEDAIARKCNKQLNLRILPKPLRIEIDNPAPPILALTKYWPDYIGGKVKAFHFLMGIEGTLRGDVIVDNRLYNPNEYSCVWFGASGSGKTQAMLGALLTLCATTSPDELSVIVIDPKGLDFPVGGLPHLAAAIFTDPTDARAAIMRVADLLQSRAASRDRSASRKRVLIVIDELKYLQSKQEDEELVDALADIGAMGRAWGISMFAGSQRGTNEFFPKRIHSQLPATWAGRVKDGTESNFIGAADADKLPGKGAAYLIEPDGTTRLQSAYIGDASKDDYPKLVGAFVKDVQAKWGNVKPHWTLQEAPGSAVEPVAVQPAIDEADPLMAALVAAYSVDPAAFNKQRVKDIAKRVTGKGVNHQKATELHGTVTKIV